MTNYYILIKDEGFSKVFHCDDGPLTFTHALIKYGEHKQNGNNPILVKQIDVSKLEIKEVKDNA